MASEMQGKKRKTAECGDGSRVESSPPRRVLRSATSTPMKPAGVVDPPDLALYSMFDIEKRRRMKKEMAEKKELSLPVASNLGRAMKFPPRLLDVSEIPETGKLTTYSKPQHLLAIKGTLGGGKYYKAIRDSPLGTVFDIPVKKAAMSGRLVHNMLCRTLLTRKRHELWFVIANKPIRFSLKEFFHLTGLPCGPYPPAAEIKRLRARSESKDAYWNQLMVGRLASGLINDIVDLLWDKEELAEERAQIPMATRLRLCLVVLVDGILCPNGAASVKASRLTVEMVRDVEKFLAFPWGRFSFDLTLEVALVGSASNETVDDLLKRLLRQTHICLKGFPVAFQMLWYATVPAFNAIVYPDPMENPTDFHETTIEKLDLNRAFSNDIISKIDLNPQTQVISILEYGYELDGVDLSWEDELTDPLVENVISKIKTGYIFKKENWKKGLIDVPPAAVGAAVAKKKRAPQRKSSRPARKSTRASAKEAKPKTVKMDPSKFFVHNPKDPINDLFYTTVHPIHEEKKKREAKFKAQSDNQFFVDVMNALIEITKAQNIFAAAEEFAGSSADSAEGAASSNSVEDVTARQDAKGKGKEHEILVEEAGVDAMDIPSEDDEVFKALGMGTSGMRQPTFDETPKIPKRAKASAGFTWAELMGHNSVEEDADMAAIEAGLGDEGEEEAAKSHIGEDPVRKSIEKVAEDLEEDMRKGIVCGLGAVGCEDEQKADEQVAKEALAVVIDHQECGFNPVEESKLKAFYKAIDLYVPGSYIVYDMGVPKGIFREIATESTSVSTNHMNLMLGLLWHRLSDKLHGRRAVILDTYLVEHLKKDAAKLQQKRTKAFKWHKSLQAMVNGVYAKREGNTKWIVDVDRIYAPMNWSDCHWVALCIDLTEGVVTIFDSLLKLHNEEKVVELMAPVLETLPLLIADLGANDVGDYEPPVNFHFRRPVKVAQNARTGDCGPLSVKYIELDSQGLPVQDITDGMVDNLRVNYAVDIYETFYTPLS